MDYLEYDEEEADDLFGSETEDNAIAGPSKPLPSFNPAQPIKNRAEPLAAPPWAGPLVSKGKERATMKSPQDRLDELRFMRMYNSPTHVGKGARSLKHITQDVLKANAPRIWDIGEMEYRTVAFMLNEVPVEQLTEIEANSPHLRKETDWLWEFHLLKDHPLYYDQCRESKGKPRTSGWRRMYKRALEDQEQRKTNAVDKLAQRYKELEDQKQARKVVFVDKMTVPTKGKAARGRQGGMVIVKAGQPRQATAASAPPPKGIFGKAKAEAQRAKVALVHASGQFDPRAANRLASPARPKSSNSSGSVGLFSNTQSAAPTANGPRLPAPRSTTGTKRPREDSSIAPFPGSRPQPESRTSLPSNFGPAIEPLKSPSDRFKIDPNRFEPIKRPRVENFVPPPAPTVPVRLGSASTTPSMANGRPPANLARKPLNTAEEAAKLNSVLFMKKKPSRPAK